MCDFQGKLAWFGKYNFRQQILIISILTNSLGITNHEFSTKLNNAEVTEHRLNVLLYYFIRDIIALDVFQISLNSNTHLIQWIQNIDDLGVLNFDVSIKL